MRAAVVQALVWRVVSELMLRQGAAGPMGLEQVRATADRAPQLHLAIHPADGAPSVRWIAELGAGGGRWWHQRGDGSPRAGGDLVEPMLDTGPAALVERVERELGLRRVAPTPAGAAMAPDVLGVRVLAEVLARESASRRALGCSLGALGADRDPAEPCDWARRMADEPPVGVEGLRRLRRLVALHDASVDPRHGALAGAAGVRVVFDLGSGRLHLLDDDDGSASTLDLGATYRADGRRLARLVERVRDHLARRVDGGSLPRTRPDALRSIGVPVPDRGSVREPRLARAGPASAH